MSEGNGRDTDVDELGEGDRETLPESLEAQMAGLQAFLGEFRRGLDYRLGTLQHSLQQHALAIKTLEAKVDPKLPERVKRLEDLLLAADGP